MKDSRLWCLLKPRLDVAGVVVMEKALKSPKESISLSLAALRVCRQRLGYSRPDPRGYSCKSNTGKGQSGMGAFHERVEVPFHDSKPIICL